MTGNFTHWLLIQFSVNVEIFITLSTELTKSRCFSYGNLAVETLSKTVSTIQDNENAVSANTFWSRAKRLRMSSVTVHVLFSKYL